MKLNLPKPKGPNYDVTAAQRMTLEARLKPAQVHWAEHGYGTPATVIIFYVVKMLLFLIGACVALQFNEVVPNFGPDATWFSKTCATKFVLWSVLFEIVGMGCGSGPLSGRYLPPIGGVRYFSRRGTVRLPLFGEKRLYTRTTLDQGLYLLIVFLCIGQLFLPDVQRILLATTILSILAMGLRDRTVFLAARSEHYGAILVCLLFDDGWLWGMTCVQLSIWLWAAVSKFTPHFQYVIAVMTSNAPWQQLRGLRKKLYKEFPNDLRPSQLAKNMGRFGAYVEWTFPLILAFAPDDTWLAIGLALMVLFHGFIIAHIPMGVPLEWNLSMIYLGFVCFGGFHPTPVDPPFEMILFLITVSFLIPLVGNLAPQHVSFLPSMRYYAGNWAYSIWLFRKGKSEQLQESFNPPSTSPKTQLERLYDKDVATNALESVVAFRSMHLHGRLLLAIIDQTVDNLSEYEWLDGEVVGGWLLGWNFGDGHLHDERLLAAVQEKCAFSAGELRCIFVESQPIHKPSLSWRICDAAEGQLATGEVQVKGLMSMNRQLL